MNQKVGRITLAVALIVLGGVLIADTWLGTQITWWVARFWPALLILLGLEWIGAAARGDSPRVDGGAVALLVVVALVASNYASIARAPFQTRPFGFSFEVPPPPSVQTVPAPPAVPRLFGDVAEEVVLNHEGDAAGMRQLIVNGEGVGDIRVEQGDKFTVELRVTGYGRDTESARENARLIRLDVRPQGETTRVGVTRPAQSQKFGLVFTITVPPEVSVGLDTASGTVVVIGRKGNVRAQTSSGSIRVEHVEGTTDLRSASGSISASGLGGGLAVSTASGSIDAKEIAGRVSAQSSSGSITVSTEQVGGDYDLTAVSGNVRLAIPADASVSVNARTSSGTVTGPAWLTIGEGRGSGTGTQGDGAHQVTIRTSSGSIDLQAR